MNIGIVGSRTFPQLDIVKWFVSELPDGITLISGGAIGVDNTAAASGRARGLHVLEYLPDLTGLDAKHEYAKAYYSRNQRIVDDSDIVIAFTEKQAGGTWDTIKRARQAGKPVKIIKPKANVQQTDEAEQLELNHSTKEKGKGPFQLKRISLGSYALNLWRYLDTLQFVDFINSKDTNPVKCAEMMIPDFIQFFREYQYGSIDAITQAPKSIRNLEKKHPMDIVCQAVADKLKVNYIELFKAWDKKSRGRASEHPEIELVDGANGYIGKVVYVLDDISTTNKTLKAAVGGLMAIGIHSHGVCWVYYS